MIMCAELEELLFSPLKKETKEKNNKINKISTIRTYEIKRKTCSSKRYCFFFLARIIFFYLFMCLCAHAFYYDSA